MRLIFVALVILIAPAVSVAQTVTPDASQVRIQTPVAFQVVGITMQTYTGGIGVLGATRACSSAYGVGAKYCGESELWNSVVLPDGFGQGSSGIDDGGTVAWAGNGCANWSTDDAGHVGTIADLNGKYTSSNLNPLTRCNNAHPIMCCAPMPIPVTLPEPSASLGISTGVFALLALNAVRG